MNLTGKNKKYDAILVAGEGESSYKVLHQHKAFLQINGKSIINYVVEALLQVDSINSIHIVGKRDRIRQTLETGQIDLNYPKKIVLYEQRSNLYENIWHTFLNTLPEPVNGNDEANNKYRDKAVLIVPCDSPLITPAEIEYFISHADMDNYDHVLGLTPEEILEPFYPTREKPGMKMAYLHLKEKNFRLNNLHLVRPFRIKNRELIQRMYQYRYQRNIRNVILFSLALLGKDKFSKYPYYIGLTMSLMFAQWKMYPVARYFRKWIPKKGLETCISNILQTRFMGLEVPFPGAALDIDNDQDYETIKARFMEWQDYLNQLDHKHSFTYQSPMAS